MQDQNMTLHETLNDLNALLVQQKKTAGFIFSAGKLDTSAAEGCTRIRFPDKKRRLLPASFIRRYGAVSKEAAITAALAARSAAGTDWGGAVTGLTLLPTPLTGDPTEDGSTDTTTVFIAVTDGKKAAVQQIACPGDLAGDTSVLRTAIAERAATQCAELLSGLLKKEPSAQALLIRASQFNKYAVSPAERILRPIFPWKGDKPGDVILKSALILAFAAVLVTAGMSASERIAINHTAEDIQKAVEVYTEPPTEEETSGLPEGYQNKFASLYAVNEDVTGWLTIPDTNIDLPIMQAEDNDYYLSHDLYGNSDPYGLPYIDYRVPIDPDYWAKNTIIYGHNMNAGYVFHELIGYRDAEFYKEHPFLTFDTVYNESEWVIFAAFEANTDSKRGEVFEYYNYVISPDPERAQWYIDETTARSYFISPVDVNTDDTFLTLQTCSNNATDTKLCIVARKLREGESESDFDFSSSVNNTARVKPTFY